MISDGCMEDPHVDYVLGLHVMPYLPVGMIETKKGALNGSSTDLQITVRGLGCHAAYPEKGVDAIMIAAHVVTALHSLVSRYVSPLDSAVLDDRHHQRGHQVEHCGRRGDDARHPAQHR